MVLKRKNPAGLPSSMPPSASPLSSASSPVQRGTRQGTTHGHISDPDREDDARAAASGNGMHEAAQLAEGTATSLRRTACQARAIEEAMVRLASGGAEQALASEQIQRATEEVAATIEQIAATVHKNARSQASIASSVQENV